MWLTLRVGWASLVTQLVKNPPGRTGLNPWVGKIPWRRERLPTPVFWPGEFHAPSMGSQSQTWLSGFHSVSYSNTFLWPTAIHHCQINVPMLFWQSSGCMVYVELCNFWFIEIQMVTAAMKSKDACSLEEKLWPT